MKSWHRYAICIAAGLIGGTVYAVHVVRAGVEAGEIRNGPWSTGGDFGTKQASAKVRAQVALAGLLALPKKEAMYFTARTDSDGNPLDGRCSYEVKGGKLDGRWWSVTLYKGEGWLVKNAASKWSIPAHEAVQTENGDWTFFVSPDKQPAAWLPTGDVPQFDMTLRVYHPSDAMMADAAKAALPSIVRTGCNA